MGNNQSNPSSRPSRSSTIRSSSSRPRTTYGSQDSQPSPAPAPVPHTAPPNVTSFGAVPAAPPPYAMTDPVPGAPPPVPPRDRTYHGRSISNDFPPQDPGVTRRASYHPPTSFNTGATAPAGQGHLRSISVTHQRPPRVDWRTGRPSQDPPPTPASAFPRGQYPIPGSQDSQGSRSPTSARSPGMESFPEDAEFGAILGNTVRSESPPSAGPRQPPPPVPRKRLPSLEDPLELLRRYDTVLIVDDSTSMDGPLWYEARDALAGIADVAARYDLDGIDVHFLNNETVGNGLKNGAEVQRLFDKVSPYGITPTGEKLEELLLDYLLKLEAAKTAQLQGDAGAMKRVKPVNFLVITDGAATDDPESVIVQAARRLDEGRFPLAQVGIQFVQIGTDPNAAEALRVLDDDLAAVHGVRDIVDTYPYSAEGSVLTADSLAKILLGGINRRLDRRNAST